MADGGCPKEKKTDTFSGNTIMAYNFQRLIL